MSNQKIPALSAVIITFNEEKNIARCLASLQGLVEEIVVVDSYSTDRTEEICRAAGARFLQHPFRGHIEQKNYATSQAVHRYVLSLDADEELSEELRESIKEAKENWQAEGYYMNRLNWYCDRWIRWGGWYPDRKLRLFDREAGSWKGKNPHDAFELNGRGRTARLEGDLRHYTYFTLDEHLQQINKFSTIVARSMYERGDRLSMFTAFYRAAWRFIRDYFLRLGLLNGRGGFLVYRLTSLETFLKYTKAVYLKEHHRANDSFCLLIPPDATEEEALAGVAALKEKDVGGLHKWVLLLGNAVSENHIQNQGLSSISLLRSKKYNSVKRLRRIGRRMAVKKAEVSGERDMPLAAGIAFKEVCE